MMSSIQFRGPDDNGEYLAGDVQLGIVRLAIVDPKEGAQPVHGCRRDVVSVYNGELYNHYSLRQQMVKRGHVLASGADTEMLPHLYEEYGVDFSSKLRGMYALALWDESERRLVISRDRLGIKPLYYSETPDFLIFASEIKAIISSGLVETRIDLDSLDDLFSLSYPCPPRSMFSGISELRPGHVLEASAGNRSLKIRRYWTPDVPELGAHRRISRADAYDELRSLLKLKVYDHLAADVPVGAYLSGGLDSSAICALMKDVTGDPPETFSISFDSPEFDESANAQDVATYLGAPNTLVKCGADLVDSFPEMIWHTELPLQFPLALPLMRLAAAARGQGYPVVLTGEGADEIFGGYDCFRADKMRRMLDRPGLRFLRPQVYRQLYKWHQLPDGTVDMMLDNQRAASSVARNYGGILPPWYDVWTTVGIDRQRLLGVEGRIVRPIDEPPEGFDQLIPENIDRLHPLDAAIALEQSTRLPSWILLIGDRASMSQGVEARVPFLDHDVVDFVASLPPSLKMQGFQEKAALRGAIRPLLPATAVSRQKRPFFTPIKEWFFSNSSPDYVQDLMSERAIRNAGLFDPKTVSQYLRELKIIPNHMLMRSRLEWTLILVLGSQILHHMFIERQCELPSAEKSAI